ncbi:MAG: hypothetical protein ABR576_04565 [Thermoanaerobaculia bacterium]
MPLHLSAVATTLLLAVGNVASEAPAASRLTGQAGEVVRKSIEHVGGWKAWNSKRTVQFRKTVTRYRPDGKIERHRVQTHQYVLRPEFRGRIEWEEEGKRVVMINDGNDAWKIVDGLPGKTQEDRNSARNNTFGSHYVFGMPFKLTDRGAILQYEGRVPLGRTTADRIKVTYERGAGDAGGLHTWVYFFDAGTGRLLANNLQYGEGKYDYTEYLDERPTGDLLLPMRRLGYNANAKGKLGRRNSEIIYEDVRWNVDLPASLFARPR